MKAVLALAAIALAANTALGQCPSCPGPNDYPIFTNTNGRVCLKAASGGAIPAAPSLTYTSSGSLTNISIDLGSSWISDYPIIEIAGSTSFTQLGNIVIKSSSASQICQVQVHGCSPGTRTGSIGRLAKDSTSTGDVILAECRLAGDIGASATSGQFGIEMDSFNTGDIGGTVQHGIKILKGAHSVGGGAYNIFNVTVGGDIVGDVTLPYDSYGAAYIGTLTVAGTIGGASGATSAITAPGGIIALDAASINANISTMSGGGPVHRIKTTNSSVPYAAAMELYKVAPHSGTSDPGIQLAGNLTGSIKVDRELDSSSYIKMPTGGLQGQISLNTSNQASPSSYWGGYVQVDGTKLSPASGVYTSTSDIAPYYSHVSSLLGGGAVGLAPYHLYANDCSPTDRDVVSVGASHGVSEHLWDDSGHQVGGTPPVLVRFYGPIQKSGVANWLSSTASTSALKIQCIPLNVSTCVWQPAEPMFVVKGPGDSGWTDARGFGIFKASGAHVSPGIYRVIFQMMEDADGNPTVPTVVCADVSGYPGVVATLDSCYDNDPYRYMTYQFRVWADCDSDGRDDEQFPPDHTVAGCNTGCITDFNRSGTITVQDLFDFLNAWFSGTTCLGGTFPPTAPTTSTAAPCLGTNVDYDGSGTVNVGDIFAFINAWFSAYCP